MAEAETGQLLEKARAYLASNEYPEAISICKDALRQLEEGSHMPGNDARRLQVLFCLSEICHVSGNWVDGLMYLSTVIGIASQVGDIGLRTEAVIRSGDILSKMGKWHKAMEKYDEAERYLRQFRDTKLLGRMHLGKGTVLWRQGRYQDALRHAEDALDLGREVTNLDLIGTASALKASIHFDLRNYEKAIDENDAAMAAYKALNNTIDVARVLNNKGEVYKMTGELDRAIETFQDGLAVLSNSMNNRSLGYLYTNLAECQIRRGSLLDSQITSKLAQNSVSLSEDRYIKAQLSMVLGLIEHRTGNRQTALKYIREAESQMKRLDIPYDLGVIQLELARMLKDTDTQQASDEYRNAISSFRKADTRNMILTAETELNSLGF